jgi:hypothetical protein
MLYTKNNKKELSKELFRKPTSEYRGTPFWAWNCKLEKEMLLKQIDQIKEMGMGGAHIHCRTGLATEYLGNEFMSIVNACDEKLKKEEMLCWLYDEDKWPSGFAGGLVTKDEKYRSRFLIFTPKSYEENADEALEKYDSSGRAQRSDNRTLLGKYEIVLKDGYLAYYKRLNESETASKGGKLWWAYLEVSGNNPWFNNQTYVNTLDKEAINKFIETTHEKYYKELGHEFGKSIPAIFTDEPQFTHKESLGYAEEERDIALPFTDDFEETYKNTYGNSLLDSLPELLWELPQGEISIARYRYHDHLSERFTTAFSDNIGSWCKDHGIMLTGHMMDEPTLGSQTRALGEAMRSYRSFQLPGIDMLCDWREYTTAKQAQSAANQYGRDGVISELYGVTNWDFDFRGHKLAGDWQAALGVTVRVHHLTWTSMGGEAKRDYPASIGYQSPWYKEYPLIEDHFSRLNTAMTRGKAHVRVGMIHPIESYWLHFGPQEQTSIIREELETNFENITEWLLFGLVDFHFISESLFKAQCEIKESPFLKVGEMEYDVILVPGNETLRSTTLERLEAFTKGGGKVVFIGEPAQLVDAIKSDRAINLAKDCSIIPFTKSRILDALEENREIDIRKKDGARCDNLFYQMRVDGPNRWLFICHVNKMNNPDISSMEAISIRLKGNWIPTIYDTITGEIKSCSAVIKGCETWISHKFSEHDSLLLCLEPGSPKLYLEASAANSNSKEISLKDPVSISLSEPNVLLLDMAEYSFDNGEWMQKEEVLRIDNQFRRKLGYPLRMDAMAQPWVNSKEEAFEHTLSLKFTINSEVEVKKPSLALENAENTTLIVNGAKIASKVDGWFVDECIKKVQLPTLPKGQSEIIMEIPFNSKTNVEWSYLLGDFGVKINGSHATIIEPVKNLSFGDWTNQGLPFYAGNVTYHCEVSCENGELNIETPQFRNPLLSVSIDNRKAGQIAFAPYKLNLGLVDNGKHVVDITAFGNRVNTFGTLHNCNRTTTWFGPDSWRTTGNNWAYEYQLKPMGILIKPTTTIKN